MNLYGEPPCDNNIEGDLEITGNLDVDGVTTTADLCVGTWCLPNDSGTIDYVLKTDGVDQASWQPDAGSFDQDLNTNSDVIFNSVALQGDDWKMTSETPLNIFNLRDKAGVQSLQIPQGGDVLVGGQLSWNNNTGVVTLPATQPAVGEILKATSPTTLDWAADSGNPFDQDLNKTDAVEFKQVTVTDTNAIVQVDSDLTGFGQLRFGNAGSAGAQVVHDNVTGSLSIGTSGVGRILVEGTEQKFITDSMTVGLTSGAGGTQYTLPNDRGTNDYVMTMIDTTTGETDWKQVPFDDTPNFTSLSIENQWSFTNETLQNKFFLRDQGNLRAIEVDQITSDVFIGGNLALNANLPSDTYIFPFTRGTAGQILKDTLGDGNLSWEDESGGGGGGGKVQFGKYNRRGVSTFIGSTAGLPLQMEPALGGDYNGSFTLPSVDDGLVVGSHWRFKMMGSINPEDAGQTIKFRLLGDAVEMFDSGFMSPNTATSNEYIMEWFLRVTNITGGNANIIWGFHFMWNTASATNTVNNYYNSGTLNSAFDATTTTDLTMTREWGATSATNQLITSFSFMLPVWDTLDGNAELDNILVGDGSAASPSISFTNDTNTGLFRSGADMMAVTNNGTPTICFEETKICTQDNVNAQLGSTSDINTTGAVTILLQSLGAIASGLVLKVVDSGGNPRVTPITALDPDSTSVIGVSASSTAGANEDIVVAVGGIFECVVQNGTTISIGDNLEKSDTVGQDGRVFNPAPGVGTFGIALSSGTGDVGGTVKVKTIFRKNESF